MALGGAALAIQLQQGLGVHLVTGPVGQEPGVVQEQLARSLLHHQHDAAGTGPGRGLAAHLVEPGAWLCGRSPDGSHEVGLGHAIQHRVVADAGHVRAPPLLQRGEELVLGEARIEADGGDPARQVSTRPISGKMKSRPP